MYLPNFKSSGILILTVAILVLFPETNETIPISMPMENNWDFDCTLKINPELLTAYNETNHAIIRNINFNRSDTCTFSGNERNLFC